MKITDEQYGQMVKKATPNSPKVKNFVWAFLVGGGICAFGQVLLNLYQKAGLEETRAAGCVSCTLVVLAALLTGLGWFDKIAKRAGAGTLVPITGFANAVVSPAIEYKAEGFILGVGANLFKIAGPVIAYGTVTSVIYGVIYWITTLF